MMKKWTLLVSSLWCFSLFSQKMVEVKNLSASLEGSSGSAIADSIKVDETNYLVTRGEFDIEIQENSVLFKLPNLDLELTNLPGFISKSKKFSVDTLSVLYNEKVLNKISLGSIGFSTQERNGDLQGLNLDCFEPEKFNFDSLLTTCLKKANGTTSALILQGKESTNTISDINLEIRDNSFKAKGQLEGEYSGKLVIIGEIHYNLETKILKIKINKARLGGIGVRKTLLKIFKEFESGRFKVKVKESLILMDLS